MSNGPLLGPRSRKRLFQKWREIIVLGWPITAQSTVRTAMRTTDLLVVGLFGPAAISALGLANLYARIPLVIGIGVGTGALSLSSQDTGGGAIANRDLAVSQALLLGLLLGVPVAVFGVLFADLAMKIFGAPANVVALGTPYLVVVLGTAPARHLSLVGGKALQGTGDTKTPMYIRSGTNVVNIVGSISLGLGIGPLPRLEIVGVALSTAGANVLAGLCFVGFLSSSMSEIDLTVSADRTIGKQILEIGLPRTVQGLSRTAASFPLGAILVSFGVEVFAAYQIGRRISQQLTGPLARSYNVVASILVGQSLGAERLDEVRFNISALALFGLITTLVLGVAVFVNSAALAGYFVTDPLTLRTASVFLEAFAIAAVFRTLARIYAGALQGGGETTKPFIAELVAGTGVLLGVTYVGGVLLEMEELAAFGAIVLSGVVRLTLVFSWFRGDGWIQAALDGMAERGSISDD